MKQLLSRSVVFVDTNPKNEKLHVWKIMPHLPSLLMMTLMFSIKAPLTDISIAGPHELESMCIAELILPCM